MAKEFVPYPELEGDLEILREELRVESEGVLRWVALGKVLPTLGRLLAAFKERECGAVICHGHPDEDALLVYNKAGEWIKCVCRQPSGHDGPHIPDLPAECWRMPDGSR